MLRELLLFEQFPFLMKIDDTRIISKISKEQGVNLSEAEKAIDLFYKLIGKEIASSNLEPIEIKHLGKLIPKKKYFNGTGTNNDSRRAADIQSVCENN